MKKNNVKKSMQPPSGIAVVSAVLCFLIGIFCLIGWQFEIDFFKRGWSGNWSLNPWSALCFTLSGTVVGLLSMNVKLKTSHNGIRLLSALIGFSGAIRLLGFAGVDLKLDLLLYPLDVADHRMSIMSACSFVLLAISLQWLDSGNALRKRVSDVASCVILALGALSLTAFTYGNTAAITNATYNPLSLLGGIALFFMGLGLLSARPSLGLARVFPAARGLLPLVALLPLALGIFRTEIGNVLSTFTMILVLAFAVWRCAKYLSDMDQLINKQSGLLESVLAGINDGVVVADKQGEIVMSNPAAQKLMNLSLYIKNNDLWRDRIHFEGEEFDPLSRALSSRSLHNSEVVFNSNGQVRYLDLSGLPIVGVDGEHSGGVAVIRDVSMFRLAAKSMQQSNDELEKVVAERVAELGKAKSQIEQLQKLDAVGRLAGGIAHDFNNMLGAIQMYCDLILRKMDQPSVIENSLAKIQKAVARGAALTRQFLIFSKEKPGPKQTLNMNELFTDHVKLLQRLTGENIAINLKLSEGIHSIKADPHQLELVIMNLVINAKDAMPFGGALTIETRNEMLTEEFAKSHLSSKLGPHVAITVSDTGEGMEEAVRSKIFEPFFTTKTFGTATGLGLSTVYGIVKSLEGTIWVYSEVGKGSVFKIYIPVAAEQVSPLQLVGSNQDRLGGSETVLVVEDDPLLRGIYQELLEQHGYDVIIRENGKDALSLIQEGSRKIDVVVTDMVMPEMGGAELGAHLARLKPDAKILFISGYSGDRAGPGPKEIKNSIYLQKPFNTQTMLTKIRELIAA